MSIGVIIDALSVVVGGLLGSLIKERLSQNFKDNINLCLGISSMGMGITSIILMKNMPAVVFALILGTGLGLFLHLGRKIHDIATFMQKTINSRDTSDKSEQMVTAVVLFCASGTGIYGSLVAGMSGDQTILIAKSILDFFTAMIFACSLGRAVSLIAIPQFVILFLLSLIAGWIVPMTTPDMMYDFKACGGLIMLATGFRMIQLRMFPIADMIPAMILVMPFSWIWANWVLQIL